MKSKNKQMSKSFKIVAVIAIMLIPTIYTTFFLGSMWDPYEKINNLPVAVVNNDMESSYNGNTLNVGKELVEKLKDSKDMAFNFVDGETAKEGLENGTYYMVITIPEDFSKNASTVMDDNPTNMELQYETNPGTNYIASKMSETALEKIKNNVAEKVTEKYVQVVADKLKEVGEGMTAAVDGTNDMITGVDKLKEGNKTISDNLKVLAESSLKFVEGQNTLKVGLDEYTKGVSNVNTGMGELANGINTLNSSSGILSDGVSKLYTGAQILSSGFSQYSDGVDSAYNGSKQLISNNKKLNDGVAELSAGVSSLSGVSSKVVTGLNELSNSIGAGMSTENTQKVSNVVNGLGQINQGINNLSASLSSSTSFQQLQQAITQLSQNAEFQSLPESQRQAMLTAMTNLGQELTALQTNVSTINNNANVLLPGATSIINNYSSSLGNIKQNLDKSTTNPIMDSGNVGLIQAAGIINNGLTTVKTAVNGDGTNGNPGLVNGIKNYTEGVSALNQGLNKLNENSPALTKGISDLGEGTKKLNDSIPSLTTGVSKLQHGSNQLLAGTNKLVTNNSTIMNGVNELSDGANKISSGASKLADGSDDLGDGLNTLSNGVGELNTKLADGADQINDNKFSDKSISMFASPIDAEETYMSEVDNNGSAMSAYMMSVGLWVASLAFCIMFSPENDIEKGKVGFSKYIRKLALPMGVAVLQGMLMVVLLNVFNGYEPKYFMKTIFMACLASVTFMTVIYFFNLWLGKVGSYVLLIFMCLQLSGSAGTYPIELSGGLFKALHPFMPFTYTVNAFRSTIATGTSLVTEISVLAGILIVFLVLIGILFNIRGKKIADKNIEVSTAA